MSESLWGCNETASLGTCRGSGKVAPPLQTLPRVSLRTGGAEPRAWLDTDAQTFLCPGPFWQSAEVYGLLLTVGEQKSLSPSWSFQPGQESN